TLIVPPGASGPYAFPFTITDGEGRSGGGTIALAVQTTTKPLVVISQVYGGGGNSGATLKNDFIELFNAGATTVPLSGGSVQYASAGGSSWQVTNLTGAIAPGARYLVSEAPGAGGTVNLPVADASGAVAMSATAGRVALVQATAALAAGSCPSSANGVIDFVGYGATSGCGEGGTSAPAPSNTRAVLRRGDGCIDSDNNNPPSPPHT